MAKNVTRDYVVRHSGLGSGVNGPAFVAGDEIGPADFDKDFDFQRLLDIGAVAKKSDADGSAPPATVEEAAKVAQDTGEPQFVQIPVAVHPDADVPQGQPSLSPVNPEQTPGE